MRNRIKILSFPIVLFIFIVPLHTNAARLWTSGCEFQGDSPGTVTDGLEFDNTQSGSNSMVISTVQVRSGISACRANQIGLLGSGPRVGAVLLSTATSSNLYARTYLYISTMATTTIPAKIIAFWDRGVDAYEGGIALNPNGKLTYMDDNVAPVATSTLALTTGVWYRIELNYNDVSGGELLIDGVSQFTIGSHNGDAVDSVFFGCEANNTSNCGADLYFDDMAVNDSTGSLQNSWPGAGSVINMQPDSAGDVNNCAAGDVTSIDEITPDDATTICTLTTDAGGDNIDVNTESSSSAGINSSNSITLVQVGAREGATTAAAESWTVGIKSASGGTTLAGTTVSDSLTTYQTNGQTVNVPRSYSLTSYTDPTTGIAWTPTGTNSLDNMQIRGHSVDGNPDIKLSTLWAIVEYIPNIISTIINTPTIKSLSGTLIINGQIIIQ